MFSRWTNPRLKARPVRQRLAHPGQVVEIAALLRLADLAIDRGFVALPHGAHIMRHDAGMPIQLRAWETSDAEWCAQTAANDEMIQRFTSESAEVTAAQVRAAIVELLAGPHDAAGFLIADTTTGERLGNIALSYEDGVGDVSYWVASGARGRGVATTALREFSRWAFDTLRLRELRLWTHPDNLASQAVAERAGYVRDPANDREREIKNLNMGNARLPSAMQARYPDLNGHIS